MLCSTPVVVVVVGTGPEGGMLKKYTKEGGGGAPFEYDEGDGDCFGGEGGGGGGEGGGEL